MSGQTSEAKTLPPSQKRLRDARRKGQIPKVRDLVSALSLAAAGLYLVLQAGRLTDALRTVLLQIDRLQNEPLSVAAPQVGTALAEVCVGAVLPLLVLLPAVGFVASTLANGGLLFALEPISPKLEHLDPIAGIKRVFGVRSLIELLKTIGKAAVLGVVLALILAGSWDMLVRLPTCGFGCIGFVVGAQAKLLLAIGVGASLAAGVGDVLIQRWLFRRDLRMSVSELKRELKEQEGDPQVRGAHKRERQESTQAGRVGLKRATLLVCGRGVAVGLRYVRGEGAPVLVCRAKGEAADVMAAAAAELRIPRATAHELAAVLARRVQPGSTLPSRHFNAAARVIFEAGLV